MEHATTATRLDRLVIWLRHGTIENGNRYFGQNAIHARVSGNAARHQTVPKVGSGFRLYSVGVGSGGIIRGTSGETVGIGSSVGEGEATGHDSARCWPCQITTSVSWHEEKIMSSDTTAASAQLDALVMPRTQILVEQGWAEESPGRWMPPTSYTTFEEDKAIEIASHPDFRLILALKA